MRQYLNVTSINKPKEIVDIATMLLAGRQQVSPARVAFEPFMYKKVKGEDAMNETWKVESHVTWTWIKFHLYFFDIDSDDRQRSVSITTRRTLPKWNAADGSTARTESKVCTSLRYSRTLPCFDHDLSFAMLLIIYAIIKMRALFLAKDNVVKRPNTLRVCCPIVHSTQARLQAFLVVTS